jgi:hypothetical protein
VDVGNEEEKQELLMRNWENIFLGSVAENSKDGFNSEFEDAFLKSSDKNSTPQSNDSFPLLKL